PDPRVNSRVKGQGRVRSGRPHEGQGREGLAALALAKRRLPAGEDKCLLATTPTAVAVATIRDSESRILEEQSLFLQTRSLHVVAEPIVGDVWMYVHITYMLNIWMSLVNESIDSGLLHMEGSVIMSTALNAYHTPPRIDSSR
ncbi:hypothetical protein GGU10DRAFT_336486, partial [Lentinula aff. detonsa]